MLLVVGSLVIAWLAMSVLVLPLGLLGIGPAEAAGNPMVAAGTLVLGWLIYRDIVRRERREPAPR